jgi:hypothetical protein
MSTYTPDVWVVLELVSPNETIQKVFAGWYGGYAGSNSWKLNSGITQIRKTLDGWYEFDGYSGSTYRCHENNYHMSSLMQGILSNWQKQADETGKYQIRIISLEDVAVC